MPDQAVQEAWPSAGETRVSRAIMIASVVVIAAALLRDYGQIFDVAAIGIVISSVLLYRATHPTLPDRPSPP